MKNLILLLALLGLCFSGFAQKVDYLYQSYLTSNVVTSVAQKNDSTLLVAAYSSGVNEKLGDTWHFQSTNECIYINVVKAAADDSYWVGCDNWGGLLNVKDGKVSKRLNSSNIKDIFVKDNDKLWLCTKGEGAVYYNAGDTTRYLPSNANIPSDWVMAVDNDSKGNLWFATLKGLVKYDGATWTSWTTSNSGINAVRLEDVVVDQQDRVWLAARDSGVVMFDGVNFTRYFEPEAGYEVYCHTITCDSEGLVWAAVKKKHKIFGGGTNGIVTYKDGQWTLILSGGSNGESASLPYADELAVIESVGDKVYVGGSKDRGLLEYSAGKWKAYNAPKFPRDVTFSDDGAMYVASDEAGVLKYKDGIWEDYNIYNTAFDRNGFMSLYVLEDSLFAVGVENPSMVSLKGDAWHKGVGNNSEYYYDIVEGKNDTLWLGAMSTGLYSYADGVLEQRDSALIGQRLLHVAYDATDNSLWFSGWDTIFHWNGKVLEKHKFEDVGFTTVNDIVVDGDGVVWLATYNGLVKYSGSDWTFYTPNNSDIPGNVIDQLTIDSKGKLWLAMRSASVVSFDRQSSWVEYDYDTYGLPSWQITALSVDAKDRVYVGYWQTGLVRLDPNSTKLKNTSASKEDLRVYPNPVSSSFILDGEFLKNNTMRVFSISGKTVAQYHNVHVGQRIDASSFKNGIFIIELRDEYHTQISRFVKVD